MRGIANGCKWYITCTSCSTISESLSLGLTVKSRFLFFFENVCVGGGFQEMGECDDADDFDEQEVGFKDTKKIIC